MSTAECCLGASAGHAGGGAGLLLGGAKAPVLLLSPVDRMARLLCLLLGVALGVAAARTLPERRLIAGGTPASSADE